MALDDVGVRIDFDGRAARQEAKKTGDEFVNTARDIDKTEKSMNKLSKTSELTSKAMKALGGLLAVSSIVKIGSAFARTATEADLLRGQLVTMTGDVDRAGLAFDKLTQFAKETPFTLDQSVNAFTKLTSLGLKPSEDALRSYGNTAAAMGKSMSQFIEAVADASTNEFERLKEFGVKARQEKDSVTFTFQGMSTTVKKNSEEIQTYLQSIGDVQFAGAMENQMSRLPGLWSNLEDSVDGFFRAIGDSGGTKVLGDAILALSGGVVKLTENMPLLISTATTLAKVIGVGGALYVGVQAMPSILAATGVAYATLNGAMSSVLVTAIASGGPLTFLNTTLFGTSLAATAASGAVGKLKIALGFLAAAFVGFEIGSYLEKNFIQAKIAGLVFVELTLKGIEQIKLGYATVAAYVTLAWDKTFTSLKLKLKSFLDAAAAGFEKIPKFGKGIADSIKEYSNSIEVDAKQPTNDFAASMVKAAKEYGAANDSINDFVDTFIAYHSAAKIANTETKESSVKLEDLVEKTEDQVGATKKLTTEMDKLGKGLSDTLTGTLGDVFNGTIKNFKEFASSIKSQFVKLLADLASKAATSKILISLGLDDTFKSLSSKTATDAATGGVTGGIIGAGTGTTAAIVGPPAPSALSLAWTAAAPAIMATGAFVAVVAGIKALEDTFKGTTKVIEKGIMYGIKDGQVYGNEFEKKRKDIGGFHGTRTTLTETPFSDEFQAELQSNLDSAKENILNTFETLGYDVAKINLEKFNSDLQRLDTRGGNREELENRTKELSGELGLLALSQLEETPSEQQAIANQYFMDKVNVTLDQAIENANKLANVHRIQTFGNLQLYTDADFERMGEINAAYIEFTNDFPDMFASAQGANEFVSNMDAMTFQFIAVNTVLSSIRFNLLQHIDGAVTAGFLLEAAAKIDTEKDAYINLQDSLGAFYSAFESDETKFKNFSEDLERRFVTQFSEYGGNELPKTAEDMLAFAKSIKLVGPESANALIALTEMTDELNAFVTTTEANADSLAESKKKIDDAKAASDATDLATSVSNAKNLRNIMEDISDINFNNSGASQLDKDLHAINQKFSELVEQADGWGAAHDEIAYIRQAQLHEEKVAIEALQRQAELFTDSIVDQRAYLKMSDFQRSMTSLLDDMYENIDKAAELGEGPEQSTELYYDQLAKLIDELEDDMGDMINTVFGDDLQDQILTQQQALSSIQNAERDLYNTQMDRYRNAINSEEQLAGYLDGLKTGNLSTLNAEDKIAELLSQFNSASNEAYLSQDADSASLATNLATSLLEMQKEFTSASSTEYAEMFRFIETRLTDVQSRMGQVAAPAELALTETTAALESLLADQEAPQNKENASILLGMIEDYERVSGSSFEYLAPWAGWDFTLDELNSIVSTGSYSSGTGMGGLPEDGLINAHKGEIIIDPASSEILRNHGINITGQGAANDDSNQRLREEIRELSSQFAQYRKEYRSVEQNKSRQSERTEAAINTNGAKVVKAVKSPIDTRARA